MPPLANSNLPIRRPIGAGERPLLVPEQLALENAAGQGRDVERDERLALAGAVLMQGPGDQFLAGAAFALNQHGAVGRRDELERLDDLVHLGAGADHPLEAELFVEPAVEFGVAADQPHAGRRLLHGGPQLVDIERLGEIGVGAVLHRP